jgi:hypothetical protein
MPNWQVTATTVRCEAVDDEVTLLVYKDWSVKCTGYPKYSKNGHARAKAKTRRWGGGCEGEGCRLALEYGQKLQGEEAES